MEEKNVVRNLDKSNLIQMTKEGKKELEERLTYLINEERPKVQVELSEARAQGDLSENADYDAAKNKQAEVESEIATIEDKLSRAEVIANKKNSGEVRMGSKVTYKKGNKEVTVVIVPEAEFNPMADIAKVGSNAPIAIALMNAKVGDEVTIHAAATYKVTITKID
jgi:transcription elongation factor GreA